MNSFEKPLFLPAPRRVKLTKGMITLSQASIPVSGLPPAGLLNNNDLHLSLPTSVSCGEEALTLHKVESIDSIIQFLVDDSESVSEEGYRLTSSVNVESGKPLINISASNETGFYYGFQTFRQLIRQYGRVLPCLEIEDHPSFKIRGVMLDISRDRVPRFEELLKIVDLLSAWKINHLQLYTEHTFAYQGHETVWLNASPYLPEEIRKLDKYCSQRGIDLTPNQNCFGHMQRWLKHAEYSHLAETNTAWDFNGHPRHGAFSLCPIDPGSSALVGDLLDQLLPNFSSKLVNIGCDETFDVGQGRSRAAVERYGFASVYSAFVKKICTKAASLNYRPMFWADIALSHPEALGLIKGDPIALAWGYEPDAPFTEWCRILKDKGYTAWVCPGTSSWRSITGRTAERRGNIIAAAEQGSRHGCEGYLVTDWGDLGHRQQAPITLHALSEAVNAAWNAGSASNYDPRASSLFAFDDDSGEIGGWLDKLGDVDLELRKVSGKPDRDGNPTPLRNATAMFQDMETPLSETVHDLDPSKWHTVKEKLDELRSNVPDVGSRQIHDELSHILEVAGFAVDRAITRRSKPTISRSARHDLTLRISSIIEEHRRLWLFRSRQGGLDDSCSYYEKVLAEL